MSSFRNKAGEFPTEERRAQKDYEQRYYMKKTEEVSKVIEKEQIKLEEIKEKKRKRNANRKNKASSDDDLEDDEDDDEDLETDNDDEEEEEKPKKKQKKEKLPKPEIQQEKPTKPKNFEKFEVPISAKSFEEAKLEIAQMSTEILHDPIANIKNLKVILGVTKESKLFQVQQLCILSMLALFLDLIPDYRIDVEQIDEVKVCEILKFLTQNSA
jgi:hypothetical protein